MMTPLNQGEPEKPYAPQAILLDANIWLDYFLGGREGHQAAQNLITVCIQKDIGILYAVNTASNIFYLLTLLLKREAAQEKPLNENMCAAIKETAWGCIALMQELATAAGVDNTDIAIARQLKTLHGDFEDDCVIAAAMRCGALLVSGDKTLLQHAPIAALNAEDALALLSAE